jgi:MFS transporter, SP family, inositol transporter
MAAPDAVGIEPGGDDSTISKQQWKWSVLAAMASYLDAGSIVALGAGLTLFQAELGLSSFGVGALAAIGPNAIGCAIGAFIGGGWATSSAASASTNGTCSSMHSGSC